MIKVLLFSFQVQYEFAVVTRMPHGNRPVRRRGDVYLFPQVAASVVNVCKTDQHGLEVRTIFARNTPMQAGEMRGRAIMRSPHVMTRPPNVTVVRARSKRVVRPRTVRPEHEGMLALITAPCMTHIKSEKLLNTWDEYPIAVLNGNRYVQSVVIAKELAPIACERLAHGSDEDVADVLATQQDWLDASSESAIVMTRRGVVTRVWHHDRASGSCTERRATVYSSIAADPDGIKTGN